MAKLKSNHPRVFEVNGKEIPFTEAEKQWQEICEAGYAHYFELDKKEAKIIEDYNNSLPSGDVDESGMQKAELRKRNLENAMKIANGEIDAEEDLDDLELQNVQLSEAEKAKANNSTLAEARKQALEDAEKTKRLKKESDAKKLLKAERKALLSKSNVVVPGDVVLEDLLEEDFQKLLNPERGIDKSEGDE